ncbi:MerR family transcriptional regulator [Erythrobacteraceae bacterium CFH 75059]|uniref:MerR family transcriptional regulator n=1 Tax=Qipengyuania thermophila TaxID=2509361 RepID=UPI0010217563|nr:MerR family transcriptional regulator [Qipengyuania thermophila]TCD04878.1 MerR family transcriptional regulator [Erythrobacteraceae bacterium CFH 75059]
MKDDLFPDGKTDEALRTIGEVCRALDLKPHVLRYWEQQFPELQPLKRSGGRRYYRPEDVRLLKRIDDLLNRQGYTIRGARVALSLARKTAAGAAESTGPARTHAAAEPPLSPAPFDTQQLAERLRQIRNTLAAALTR